MVMVRIICAASFDVVTPHDGRYVKAWNPHTPFGVLAVTSTDDVSKARQFTNTAEAMKEWNTVSNIESVRPDGRPNKPLTAVTVEIL